MSGLLHKKNKGSFWVAFLLALGLGWLLYRFVDAAPISLRDTPPPKPTIVPRAEWGARPLNLEAPEEFGLFDPQTNPDGVLYYPSDLRGVLSTIVIHHSAIRNASPAEIQSLHMDGRGFADVAYHFLIDSAGTIYEGREINIRGAHVQGFNTGSVGIVLLGDFNEEQPSQAQLASLRALVDYLRYTYEIRYLAGHKDYPGQSPDGTECPGKNLYPLLSGLARELGMKYGLGGYVTPEWAHPSRN
jgi:N-acetylmuramoyl-L-alanine amidase